MARRDWAKNEQHRRMILRGCEPAGVGLAPAKKTPVDPEPSQKAPPSAKPISPAKPWRTERNRQPPTYLTEPATAEDRALLAQLRGKAKQIEAHIEAHWLRMQQLQTELASTRAEIVKRFGQGTATRAPRLVPAGKRQPGTVLRGRPQPKKKAKKR